MTNNRIDDALGETEDGMMDDLYFLSKIKVSNAWLCHQRLSRKVMSIKPPLDMGAAPLARSISSTTT